MKIKKVKPYGYKPTLVVYNSDWEEVDMAPGEMLYNGNKRYKLNDDKSFDTSKDISDMIVEAQKDCGKVAIETKMGAMLTMDKIVPHSRLN